MDGTETERDVPAPELLAAWMRLDVLVDPSQVPMWAARWIADGMDTPSLRVLAGQDGRDPFDVRDLTAMALVEMGVHVGDLHEAAWLVLTDEAERCLAGLTSERTLAAALDDLYIRSGYADEILRHPLGAEHGLDDEWIGGWGRTDTELRKAIRAACERQVAHGR